MSTFKYVYSRGPAQWQGTLLSASLKEAVETMTKLLALQHQESWELLSMAKI